MNYLIHGGEFRNKGAEAMSLIAIYNIKKNDPEAKVVMICDAPVFGGELGVEFMTIPTWVYRDILNISTTADTINKIKNMVKLLVPKFKHYSKKDIRKIVDTLSSTDYAIDISGFALGDQWGSDMVPYLLWIRSLKKLNPECKIYLMPQSFGPFNKSEEYVEDIRNELSKCEMIYARENSALNELAKIGVNNTVLYPDSVLMENGYSPEKVISSFEKYKEIIDVFDDEKLVAIIPNQRLFDRGNYDYDYLLSVYCNIIDSDEKARYVLIAHAPEDLKICREIKNKYASNDRVVLIDHVLHSFNFEASIKKFSYVVASRYHSIVHSYRQGVPAVIIGWSEKYNEVAKLFDQSRYIFDIDKDDIQDIIGLMNENCISEKELIVKKLEQLRFEKGSCYEFLNKQDK